MNRLLFLSILICSSVGAWRQAAAQVEFKHEHSTANLKNLHAYAAQLRATDNTGRAVALGKSLWPGNADIAKALGPAATADTRKVVQAAYRSTSVLRARSTSYWASIVGVPRRNAELHDVVQATVTDFKKAAASGDKSLPGASFTMHPRTAASLLNPEVTFYSLRFKTADGGAAGSNSFYFWNGSQWKILYDVNELVTAYQLTNPDRSLRNVDLTPAVVRNFKQANTKDNLQKLLEMLSSAVRKRNLNVAAAIAHGLMPQGKSLDMALKTDIDAATRVRIRALFPIGKVDRHDILLWASLFKVKPKQTEVFVAGATTAEIAANVKESIAWYNFPGGAHEAAKTMLRPGRTFYTAKMLEPGEHLGMRYDLFYWDGASWKMLGKVWRALRR